MSCQTCGAQLVWRGSMARGGYACPLCDPAKEQGALHKRYLAEVHAWHRPWCAALKKRPVVAKLCDCGHSEPSPYTPEQIEQRERASQT